MKTRQGFVSNSSSSSFIIQKEHLSSEQCEQIFNHIAYAKEHWPDFYTDKEDEWDIDETGSEILLSTIMDNFDMGCFLDRIGVEAKYIKAYY